MPTDTQRINFLQEQSFTKWVGYDTISRMSVNGGPLKEVQGECTWPVFKEGNLRKEIDQAMQLQKEHRKGVKRNV